MRPIIFHLADHQMEQGIRAFFRRDDWHYAMRCARFEIDSESDEDIYRVPACTDPCVWKNAHNNLAVFKGLYERAVVVLDVSFGGSPGAARIRADVIGNLVRSGWKE